MAQQLFSDALVMVKAAPTGTNAAEIDDAAKYATYSDSSPAFLGGNIDDSGEVATIRPHGVDPRGEPLAGAVTGAITLNYVSDDGNADFDPGQWWTGIWDTPSRRFAFGIQPNRESLKTAGAVIPAAAAGNPQSTGSAVMTGLNYWGDGTAESPMLVNVTAQIARGFTRHFA